MAETTHEELEQMGRELGTVPLAESGRILDEYGLCGTPLDDTDTPIVCGEPEDFEAHHEGAGVAYHKFATDADSHMSDCATHNAPAMPAGECDCRCPRCDGDMYEAHTGSAVNCAYEGVPLSAMPPPRRRNGAGVD